jgi:hypothetical protein
MLLSKDINFKKNSFSLALSVFTLLFITIPITFQIVLGESYIVGASVGVLPFNQSEYYKQRWLSYLFLTICWLAMWLGLRSVTTIAFICNKYQKIENLEYKLLCLCVFVLYLTHQNNVDTIMVKIGESDKQNFSLLSFLLNDMAFLLFSGVLLLNKISVSNANIRLALFAYFFIFTSFVIVNIFAGSKAAILFVIIFFYVLVLCTFQWGSVIKTIKFNLVFFAFLIFISPIIYLFVLNNRLGYTTTQYFSFDSSEITNVIISIFYRLSWGGLDQYELIFLNEILGSHNYELTLNLSIYIFKNFLNLLLPGTIFIDAYYPSSALFPLVINGGDLISDFDPKGIVLSSNNQPYSIFGFFILIFGLFSPLFIYLYSVIFSKFYNYFPDPIIRIMLLYFFFSFMSCFGPEVVFVNTIQIYFSCLIMYLLIVNYKIR